MLKHTVTYIDFNNEAQTEELHFHIGKAEMADLLALQPRLEVWSRMVSSNTTRELTIPEIQDMLNIVKEIVEKSYGERSADGRHFRKNPQIFADFKDSAVYDALLYSLFVDPEKAVDFMLGVMPKDIADQAMEKAMANDGPAADILKKTEVAQLPSTEMTAVQQEVPAYIREDREPTQAELTAMSPAELQAAFSRKLNKQNQQ